MAQLTPIHGLEVYHELLDLNSWAAGFLPNARPRRAQVHEVGTIMRWLKRMLEIGMGGLPGNAVERWERDRKLPRLRKSAGEKGARSAVYTPQLCKGHTNDHSDRIHRRYIARLSSLGMLQ
jgi:hypothetical protein